MTSRQDYAIAALVGFLTGVFAVPTLVNLGVSSWPLLMALPLVVTLLFLAGLWIAGFISRWLAFLPQLAKFAEVGILNSAIDFGILNLFSAATGIISGIVVGGVNIPGFSVAVLNSYFWNKFWVFKGREGAMRDFPKFMAVSIGGLLLNSGVIVLATTYISAPAFLGGTAWLNLAKILATLLVFVWNFLGYKFLVFRKSV
ncbi:MAG: GtrA family protein [Candidatus Sungbacteria bacterium]|nr:GtrA family protein [Candidatus Sungbacteria bacterium]